MKILSAILSFLLIISSLSAQKELHTSQYMHNRYAVNTAFAGSGEALSIFGAYRKQWMGINGSPSSQLLSANTPLKNDNIALGLEFFNQNYAEFSNTGFTAAYTYRVHTSSNKWLALSLNGGLGMTSSGWSSIAVKDPTDPSFAANESFTMPIVGLGAAWYGSHFFTGLSVINLFETDIYTDGATTFKPGTIVATGGYLFDVGGSFQIQPSAMLQFNTPYGSIYDVNTSVIWNELIWVGASYRSTDDFVALLAIQPTQQFLISYSMDVNTGDIGSFNSGTHEISLKYYFGYRVKSSSPKFF